jgi:putative transcriptional regulator
MDQTQRDLAAVLNTQEQTFRLWEKHRDKAVPGPADRLLRALYGEFIGGDGSICRMLNRLAELDQLERAEGSFRERPMITVDIKATRFMLSSHPSGVGL